MTAVFDDFPTGMEPAPAMEPDAPFPPPVFVLAPPALHAPTIAAALGRNPDAYGLPEIVLSFEPTVDVYLREVSGLRAPQGHGLLRGLAQLLAGEQSLGAVEMARRWLDRRAHLDTGPVLHEIACRVAPRRMVVPVVSGLLDAPALKRLVAAFPDAHYVVLRAHPRLYGRMALASRAGQIALQLSGAVDESLDPPISDPEDLWFRAETAIGTHLAGLVEKQRVSVDLPALLADPEAGLKALARKLGLKWNRKAVAAMAAPEASVFAGPGPMGAHSNGQIHALAELAAELPAPEEATEEATLDAPLPWRPDGRAFRDEVQKKARAAGYT